MSYDLTVATHEQPDRKALDAWAAEKGFVVVDAGVDSLVIEKSSGRGDRFVCEVNGPHAAEADDFADELAAACLAPHWMIQISVPYSTPKANISHARSLARWLAEQNAGAAFDPQEDALVWPRGSSKRVPRRAADEITTVLALEWFLAPSRWEAAPHRLLYLARRLCAEALPTRYGQWEPLQHRFDPERPEEFERFLVENDDAFWHASRPSFGGSCFGPNAEKYALPEEEPQRIAHIGINFDGRVIASDHRWLETVVDLFSAVAADVGAFYAAAQVETGWTVTRNNRLLASASTDTGEHFLRRRLWQGLPPVPVWLSWYGSPYRELVAPFVRPEALESAVPRPPTSGLLARFSKRPAAPAPVRPLITDVEVGLLVQLGEVPRSRGELPTLPLPNELTYRERRDTVRADGARELNIAQPEDRAAHIPRLGE
jgi:hypothetical protein